MIEVIHYYNKSFETSFEESILDFYTEVHTILPNLPKTIKIYFSNHGIVPESGVGGFAYSKDTITISVDTKFIDRKKQLSELRSTIFHESFHLSQNYTGESGPFTAIENAIYEGMATVFEREYCLEWPTYGDYRSTPERQLQYWIKAVRQLSLADFEDHYNEWKFYHSTYKESWIIYKIGTWIIDQILEKHQLSILDLQPKKADEVASLFDQLDPK